MTTFMAFGALWTVLALNPARAQRPEPHHAAFVLDRSAVLKAAWQWHTYGGCRFSVPTSWHAVADGSATVAPDGSRLSIRMFKIRSWSAHKAQVRAAFGHVRLVHDDSDSRLWFEIGDLPRAQHFIDVARGRTACNGLLEIRTATTLSGEDVNRIADSIGPVSALRPSVASK